MMMVVMAMVMVMTMSWKCVVSESRWADRERTRLLGGDGSGGGLLEEVQTACGTDHDHDSYEEEHCLAAAAAADGVHGSCPCLWLLLYQTKKKKAKSTNFDALFDVVGGSSTSCRFRLLELPEQTCSCCLLEG